MGIGDKLRHREYCDGCEKLGEMITIGGHRRCSIYKITMLEQHNVFIANKGVGSLPRPEKCLEEDIKPQPQKVTSNG